MLVVVAHHSDVGSSCGDHIFTLHQRFPDANFCGVEITPSQVKVANDRIPARARVSFVQGAAESLPFPDQSFTAVTCIDSAYHFRTRNQFFSQAHRVLQSHGSLTLIDMCVRRSDNIVMRALHRLIVPILAKGFAIPSDNLCTMSEYQDQICLSGFKVNEMHDISSHVFRRFSSWMLMHAWKYFTVADAAKWLKFIVIAVIMRALSLPGTPMQFVAVSARKI
jgi:ubiquinone/menaquinone biosynthesis C-methylase UbiE